MKPSVVFASLLSALAVALIVATPANAEGKRKKDKAASAYGASGKHVKDITKCKENGGNK